MALHGIIKVSVYLGLPNTEYGVTWHYQGVTYTSFAVMGYKA
jgi:hypothetical protein